MLLNGSCKSFFLCYEFNVICDVWFYVYIHIYFCIPTDSSDIIAEKDYMGNISVMNVELQKAHSEFCFIISLFDAISFAL